MKNEILYYFRLPPVGRQRTGRVTRWRMREAEAAKSYPGAVRVDADSLTIEVGETPEEIERLRARMGHGDGFPGPMTKR